MDNSTAQETTITCKHANDLLQNRNSEEVKFLPLYQAGISEVCNLR